MESQRAEDDRPAKRQRVAGLDGADDHEPLSNSTTQNATSENAGNPTNGLSAVSILDEQAEKERNSGITEYVHSESTGFTGVLKQRYTDFQVNEIAENGTVLHLTTLRPPKHKRADADEAEAAPTRTADAPTEEQKAEALPEKSNQEHNEAEEAESTAKEQFEAQLDEPDRKTLIGIFGEDLIPEILTLYRAVLKNPSRKPRDFRPVVSKPIETKDDRTKAHQACRQIFNSKLETQTADDNSIKITPAPHNIKPRGGGFERNGIRQSGKAGWDELGGNFLHFTMYKENKDTMEVISFLASQLKVNAKTFQFGGTKDRRAVTAQRCSAYRIRAEQMHQMSKRLNGPTRVGDYAYKPSGIELGEIGGNEFTIGLRDCHFPGEAGLSLEDRVALANTTIGKAVANFQQDGFINYFGLQRFGTFANSTDTVGTKMLQGDLQGAVEDILQFNPQALAAANDPMSSTIQISSDDKARARAIDMFKKTGDAFKPLDILPRKFSAESNIIRYLGQKERKSGEYMRRNDYQGALQCIPRALRLMYVHAYQSLVFNVVAGERFKLYGLKPFEGDLIIVPSGAKTAASKVTAGEEVDEQGEVIVRPAVEDSATTEDSYERARPLTAEEAASGQYSIFDIVLPLPGYDIIYPANEVGDVYKTFMATERGGGLDPMDMRRSWKDVSLSGGYRKFLARPGEGMAFEVKTYAGDEEQLIETDLQRLQQREDDPVQKKNDEWRARNGYEPTLQLTGAAGGASVNEEDAEKMIAVVLKMRLGTSQYATMALRELMGHGGVLTYKADYGGGR